VSECRTCSTPRLVWSLPSSGVPLLAGRRSPKPELPLPLPSGHSCQCSGILASVFLACKLLQDAHTLHCCRRCRRPRPAPSSVSSAHCHWLCPSTHPSLASHRPLLAPKTRAGRPKRVSTLPLVQCQCQLSPSSHPHLHLPFPSLFIPHRRCLSSPYPLTLLSFLTTHHLSFHLYP
jgi:hypothetical protein